MVLCITSSAAGWGGLDAAGEGPGGERQEVHHRPRHVLRGEHPRRVVASPVPEVGPHASRHDHRDPDAVVAQVEHRRVRKAEQAELARVVGGASGERVLGRQRRDVEDVPATPALHHRRHRPQAVEAAVQVRLDHLAPLLARDLVDRREAAEAGVVDQAVDAPGALGDPGHEVVDLGLLAHVHGARLDPVAVAAGELLRAPRTRSPGCGCRRRPASRRLPVPRRSPVRCRGFRRSPGPLVGSLPSLIGSFPPSAHHRIR